MARIELTGATTVYFDPNGSDTLGIGSSANPWQTPQGTWNNLFRGYDLCGFPLTMQATVGASPAQQIQYGALKISGRLPGQGGSVAPGVVGAGQPAQAWGNYAPVTLRGDPVQPLNAILYPPASTSELTAGLSLTENAGLMIDGFTIDTGRSLSDCVQLFHCSFLDIRNIVFGAAGQYPTSGPACNHISAAFGSVVFVSDTYQIDGNGQCHAQIDQCSNLYYNTNGTDPIHLIIPYNPIFPAGFFYAGDNGIIEATAVKFVNAGPTNGVWPADGTGVTRGYSAVPSNGGVINTNGVKNIPGALGVWHPPQFVAGIYS